MKIYLVALDIDISNTPGSVVYQVDSVHTSRERAEKRRDLLNTELADEMELDDDDEGPADDSCEFRGYDLSSEPVWSVSETELDDPSKTGV